MQEKTYTSFEDLPVMMTIPQVATALNISRGGAYELAHQKNFPAILIGNRIVVPKSSLMDWLNAKLTPKGMSV